MFEGEVGAQRGGGAEVGQQAGEDEVREAAVSRPLQLGGEETSGRGQFPSPQGRDDVRDQRHGRQGSSYQAVKLVFCDVFIIVMVQANHLVIYINI